MSNNIELVAPPNGYSGSNSWKNWHGFKYEKGGGFDAHLLNEIQSKRNNLEACIIVVTGSAGKGKTYFTLRLAQILDSKFDVDVQVPFGVDELLHLISSETPLGIGRVIIIDESQYSMSSRDWYTSIQKELMKQLEAIRSRGFIIFIVALSEATLDNLARAFVITHKIHLFKRGHARCYKYSLGAFSKVPYPTTISKDCEMLLPDAEMCEGASCLQCQYSGLGKTIWNRRNRWVENGDVICNTIRAKYERKKKAFLESMVDEATENRKEIKAENVVKKLTVDDIVILLKNNCSELRLNNHGNISKDSAYNVVKKQYQDCSERIILRAVGVLSEDAVFCSKLSFKKNTTNPTIG